MKLDQCHSRQAACKRGLSILATTFCLISLSACLPTPQVRELSQKSLSIPKTHELSKVPFYPQTRHHCGPAAVATVLNHQGLKIEYDEVVNRVYLPGRRGSLQTDVISAIRRYGMLAYIIEPKLEHLLEEVANARPVLILENLGVNWLTKWHYAVVIGYDLDKKTILLRSGKQQRRNTSFKLFERTWKRSGYWGLVVLKPGDMPTHVDPLRYLQAVVGLEQGKHWQAALSAYEAAEKKWPELLLASIGSANNLYALGKKVEAATKYIQILRSHPQNADAYNNLASIQIELGRYGSALANVEKAIKLGGPNIKVYYRTLVELKAKSNGKR